MDFIRANLGATQADEKRIASLEKEVDDYKKEVSELKTQLEAVKTKLGEYEKRTDTDTTVVHKEETATADTKKDENDATNGSVESTEVVKGTENNNQISSVSASTGSASEGGGEKSGSSSGGGSGAEVDVVKEKSVADSEKAATPNSNPPTVDSAKVSNESENADTGKSNNAAATNNDDNGSQLATASTAETATATNDNGEKAKTDSGSDKAVPATKTADNKDK